MLSSTGIVAVLDWEVAHIGDPMRDLGWICTNSWRFGQEPPVGGFGEYEDLFRGYEEESGSKVNQIMSSSGRSLGLFGGPLGL